jgi:hypothetical protein
MKFDTPIEGYRPVVTPTLLGAQTERTELKGAAHRKEVARDMKYKVKVNLFLFLTKYYAINTYPLLN